MNKQQRGEVKGMTERRYKLTTGSSLIVDGNSLAIRMHEDGATFEMPVDEVEVFNDVLALVDEKDATIKELQDKSQRWEKAFDNADKQYLKQEKRAAELGRENERLRKALEEIKPYLRSFQIDILNGSRNYLYNAVNLIFQKINTALGEGDKNGI